MKFTQKQIDELLIDDESWSIIPPTNIKRATLMVLLILGNFELEDRLSILKHCYGQPVQDMYDYWHPTTITKDIR